MQTVIVVIHLMIVVALVGVVLLQRSEGGGLGIGGGSGFMTARGAANALTRATAILAGCFFITSIALTMIARYGEQPTDILNRIPAAVQGQGQKPGSGKGILDQLGGQPAQPAAPAAGGSTAPSGTAAPQASGSQTAPTEAAPAQQQAPAQAPAQPAASGENQQPATPAPGPQVPNSQ